MITPDILQLAEQGKAEDLHETLRKRCLQSIYFFAKVVLNYREMSEGLHLPFCDHIQQTRFIRKRGYLLPRGHFKSTIVSKSYPIWRLLPTHPDDPPEWKEFHNPDTRVLIVGESDTVGGKNLRDIKWNFENNQLLRWLFPEIIPPDFRSTTWKEDKILLPRTRSFDEASITTIGIGAKHTGFHYDIIIYDDPIGEKAAKSDAEMQSAITWFQYAPGLLNDNMFGEELLAGTRWKHGKADLYGWIMEEMPHGTLQSGRATGFVWYVRSAVENGEPIFPERFNLDILEEIRKREKDYKFSCQYLNNPTNPEGTDFPPAWIKTYKISEDRKTLLPSDGTPPVKILELLRMSFYDPSAGGKSAGCENAIIVGGCASDRRKFLFPSWGMNCGFGAAIEKWHELNDKFLCYRNHYEEVGAQKAVEEINRMRPTNLACPRCQKKHRRLEPIGVKPDGRVKEDRIRNYAQADFEHGLVYIFEGDYELRRQILSFPHNDLVDRFDAAAYLIKLLRPPLSAAEAEEERRKLEAYKQTPAKSFTYTEQNYSGYGA